MMCPRVHLYTWCALIAALLIVYIPRYQRWATSSFPGLGTPPAGSSKCRTLPAPAQETPRKNKQNETVAWQKSEVLIVTWYAAADSFSGFINNDGAGLGKNTIITQKTFRRTEKEHARSSSSLLLKTKKKGANSVPQEVIEAHITHHTLLWATMTFFVPRRNSRTSQPRWCLLNIYKKRKGKIDDTSKKDPDTYVDYSRSNSFT